MTPSLDAFRLFVRADRVFNEGGVGLLELLEEALAIDSAFAWAWRLLAISYGNGAQPDSQAHAIERAYQFRSRLIEAQRLAVEADYVEYVDTNGLWRDRMAAALRGYNRAVELHPTDPTLHRSRGRLFRMLGQFESALDAHNHADSVLPFGLTDVLRGNQATTYLQLGRYEEARALIPHLSRRRAETVAQNVLIGERRWDEALERVTTQLDDPTVPPRGKRRHATIAASILAGRGRLIEARTLARQYDNRGWTSCISLVTRPGSGIGPIDVPDSLHCPIGTREYTPAELWSLVEGERWREVVTVIGELVPGDAGQRHDWLLAESYLRLDRPDSAMRFFERALDPTRRDWSAHWVHPVFFPYAHRRLALLSEQLDQPDRAEDHWLVFLETVTDPDPEIQWMVDEAKERLEALGRGR